MPFHARIDKMRSLLGVIPCSHQQDMGVCLMPFPRLHWQDVGVKMPSSSFSMCELARHGGLFHVVSMFASGRRGGLKCQVVPFPCLHQQYMGFKCQVVLFHARIDKTWGFKCYSMLVSIRRGNFKCQVAPFYACIDKTWGFKCYSMLVLARRENFKC